MNYRISPLSLMICAQTLIVCTQTAFSQSKIDSALSKKLEIMFKEDQKWRLEYIKLSKPEKSQYSEDTINKNWAKTDSSNLSAAKEIFQKYGYPGYSLVGKSGSNRFWAIVQHSDDDVEFQQKVLILMDKEVKKQNASGENYAYLKDRILINKGFKQLYGTQTLYHKDSKKHTPLPIQDEKGVEARRKAIGLSPLKDYLKELDNLYN